MMCSADLAVRDGQVDGGTKGSDQRRWPAHLVLVSALASLVVIVVTPISAVPAVLGQALLVGGLAILVGVPGRLLRSRVLVTTPFLVFAALLPLIGRDPRVEVVGVSLSQPGLVAGAELAVTVVLAVTVTSIVSTLVSTEELLVGLHRLRMPSVLVEIASFMLRYSGIVSDEYARMSRARQSRGSATSGVSSWVVTARSLGVLFIRSFERGERVHRAMLSRGYAGALPTGPVPSVTSVDVVVMIAPPAVMTMMVALAWWAGWSP